MKRKLFTTLIVLGGLFFTACQEDTAMEELVNNIELNEVADPDTEDDDAPGGGSGSQSAPGNS